MTVTWEDGDVLRTATGRQIAHLLTVAAAAIPSGFFGAKMDAPGRWAYKLQGLNYLVFPDAGAELAADLLDSEKWPAGRKCVGRSGPLRLAGSLWPRAATKILGGTFFYYFSVRVPRLEGLLDRGEHTPRDSAVTKPFSMIRQRHRLPSVLRATILIMAGLRHCLPGNQCNPAAGPEKWMELNERRS